MMGGNAKSFWGPASTVAASVARPAGLFSVEHHGLLDVVSSAAFSTGPLFSREDCSGFHVSDGSKHERASTNPERHQEIRDDLRGIVHADCDSAVVSMTGVKERTCALHHLGHTQRGTSGSKDCTLLQPMSAAWLAAQRYRVPITLRWTRYYQAGHASGVTLGMARTFPLTEIFQATVFENVRIAAAGCGLVSPVAACDQTLSRHTAPQLHDASTEETLTPGIFGNPTTTGGRDSRMG